MYVGIYVYRKTLDSPAYKPNSDWYVGKNLDVGDYSDRKNGLDKAYSIRISHFLYRTFPDWNRQGKGLHLAYPHIG